jgi:hypothetical protein
MTHPLTPPDELLEQWYWTGKSGNWQNALTLAYRAGADQELEACCELLPAQAEYLRNVRRPKPPSAAAQAEALIERHEDGWVPSPAQWHIIREGLAEGRRALEALDD